MFLKTLASITTVLISSAASVAAAAPRVPFAFVENRGQASPAVRYIGTGPDFKAWFEDRGAVLRHDQTVVSVRFESDTTSTEVSGATAPAISADHATGASANYLHGSDPHQWQTGLPLFESIHYQDLWPGIRLTYKAENATLKAEYVVNPGVAVQEIRLRFDGHTQVRNDGTLSIHGPSGDFIEDKPLLYQDKQGARQQIAGGFKENSDGAITFWAGEYDHSVALVIDPAIMFSGYFGGSSEGNITAVSIDGLNNLVTAGWTTSSDLPTSHGARPGYAGSVDAFVASFLPNGGSLIYCTYLGGSGDDRAFGLAIDSLRNVHITGWTSSTNYPVVGPVQSRLSGTRDAFVTKLNPSGSALIYSTYLGGAGIDAGYAIAINSANAAVVVGDTTSSNFPATAGVFQQKAGGSQDAFIAMLSATGNTLTFATFLGGSGIDHASSVKIGPSGGIFVGGYTWSNNFPVVGALQAVSGGGQDGFVAKIGPDGKTLYWSTYLGGSRGSSGAPEEVNALCIDPQHNIIVAGATSSANFPTTGGVLQSTLGGQTDGFITRLSNSGGALLQSTFLGGSSNDVINAIAVDFHGNLYVTGSTSSGDFPVQRPLQSANAGLVDAFVAKLNPSLSNVLFGTYLGGSGSDAGNAIAVDSQTSMVVVGQTSSGDFPASGSPPSALTSFVTKISPAFTLGVGYGYQGQLFFVADPWHVSSYLSSTSYGTATDIPVAGDWSGTGAKSIGVFRNGTWYLDTNNNGILDAVDKTVVFGQAGDIPVVGDWRGTGRIALGLFRQGTFILDLSGHLSGVPTGIADSTFTFGQGGDFPIVADWSGSGATKVGIFRNGLWLVDYNGDHVFNGLDRSYVYGQAGDIPVVGDWDSSGNPSKIGVFRNGLWVLDYDGDNTWTVPYLNEMVVGFGFTGYTPLVF